MSSGDPEQKVPKKKKRGRRRKPRPLGKNGKEISASAAKLRLLKRLRCTLKFEKELWAQGATLIAGVDEVGRGALFGPVVAAAVILDPNFRIRGLRDSKLLEPEVRERLAKKIREHCIAYAIASVDSLRIDEINKAFYPIAGVFYSQVDKDMTTMTASIHKDNWQKFFDIALPQLLSPGFREDDFQRIKDSQLNALKQDLRNANEEELGKEELMNRIYAGTPYGHAVLGTVAGVQSITLDDVKKFIADHYTRGNLVTGISGDYPNDLVTRLESDLASLPQGTASSGKKSLASIEGQKANGLDVEIIEKDTRSTAISIGMPIPVTRTPSQTRAPPRRAPSASASANPLGSR